MVFLERHGGGFGGGDALASGTLVQAAEKKSPVPVQMVCLLTHRRRQNPKMRLFMEFMIERIGTAV